MAVVALCSWCASISGEESIKVFVRVRPVSSDAGERCVSVTSDSTLELHKPEVRTFTFDQVVDETASQVQCAAVLLVLMRVQEMIFSSVGKAVIENCLQGYNGTIFA